MYRGSYKKIFVPAPANVVTGGAELLHQLVDEINNHGGSAYIVYSDPMAEIPKDYKKYNLKTSSKVEDDIQNLLVLNEGDFSKIEDYKNIRIGLWWLSVDNFFICNRKKLSLKDLFCFSKRLFFKQLWNRGRKLFFNNSFSLSELKASGQIVFNAYQSEYARQFLLNNGFGLMMPLGDYINIDYLALASALAKEDAVAYNPKKGFEFTRKLIACAPELDWRPIIGLDRSGVAELLRKCKVYIDFGHHPGKDRLPREAAMSMCAIMTGRRGSAKYDEDVPIPRKYKYDENDTSMRSIVDGVKCLLHNYDTCIDEFENYRNSIKQEKSIFSSQVAAMFID